MSGEYFLPAVRDHEQRTAAADCARQAWLANKKQELLTPAAALHELSEMLMQDAAERGQEDFLAGVRQVRDSSGRLLAMIDEVLVPGIAVAEDELARRARHDLRTPLAEVLGICELWLEDAPEQLLEGFVSDLREIHILGRSLLGRLDDIFGFGKTGSDPDIDLDGVLARAVADSLPPPLEGPAAAGETGTILVVDDNATNREILVRRLGRDGHRVEVAANGRQALELLQALPFDLVLLDLIMPELNGLQVLERLKADPRLRHVPVIMISAFREVDGIVRCLEMGAADYLPKPFNSVLLRARVGSCLEKKRLRDREVRHLEQIEQQRQRADELLHVILPTEAVKELKVSNAVRPRRFEDVAVLFADIVGFTPYCDHSSPEEVVSHLQGLVESWEEIALGHGVQKIKTIGDAFMAAAGLLQPAANPVLSCLRCALDMIAACRACTASWEVRVGIHVGPVVAGVIGRRQYLYDLWGDTVNTAARMESQGVPGAVTLSAAAWSRVASCCRGQSRGKVAVKGKGAMEMFRFDEFLPV
jgi:adenylate cyclase